MSLTLISWNVNGIRAVERKKELHALLDTHDPDVFLIQEIKGNKEQFSKFLAENENYHQFYHSAEKKGYAGTGIWVKNTVYKTLRMTEWKTDVPHAPNMDEGRVSHLSFTHGKNVYDILSIYFPNGGKSTEAWEEKLVFYEKILDYMNALDEKGHRVIVGGDMNVAHTEIDLSRPKENDGKIGFHPKERAWMDTVLKNDWIDVWRKQNPGVTDVYSYWDQITRARDRNVGWRIDYFFLKKNLLKNVKGVSYLNDQMGSDHCPVLLEIEL